jgi:uncharacterized protein YbjT (DUF2867 family)
MRVYLTGANGFIGSYVLRELVERGHSVRCLLRDTSARLSVSDSEVEKVKGDVTAPKSLAGTLRGCDAVIHLVGIIEENRSKGLTFDAVHHQGTVHVVDGARESGIERFIQMSANGAAPDGVSDYQRSKWRAEEYVRAAGFGHWTIFRPSIAFGDPGPDHVEFASRLLKTLIRPFPAWPVFGDGKYQLQPISVEEVATAFVQALDRDSAHGNTYCVAGTERLDYVDTLDVIARGAGIEPKPKISQPLWLVRPIIQGAGALGVLPITPDQFEMLIEGNTCDSTAFYRDFDVVRKPFTPENLSYLRR